MKIIFGERVFYFIKLCILKFNPKKKNQSLNIYLFNPKKILSLYAREQSSSVKIRRP